VTQPYLGRCKDCEYTIFATAEDIRDGEEFYDVKPGLAIRLPNRGVFSRCTNKHRVFLLKQIKGTYSEDHKCDARCLNARGNECTCSCGGANHGRGHAVTVHKASEQPQAVEQRHLGEPGKIIKGEATVTAKRPIEATKSILYIFMAQDRSATIKWFVPEAKDPEYEIGEKITFRARVKRHEDHPQFGKSTVVTYLEEVS
jgi:hypothetical protein